MVTKDIIYQYGHFYEKFTGKRIEVKYGSLLVVAANEDSFFTPKEAGQKQDRVKSQDELMSELTLLKKSNEISEFTKICQCGEVLYFYISSSPSNVDPKFRQKYVFKVKLREDLYIILKSKWKNQEGKLYDCSCVTIANIDCKLDLFEEVYAKSLNELYKCTYIHYFGNEGSPSCNALDRFHNEPKLHESTTVRQIYESVKKQKSEGSDQIPIAGL